MTVRDAVAADAASLVRSNLAMAHETEGRELDEVVLARGVARVLADPSLGAYLVADVGAVYAGSLMVTPEWSDWRNAYFWWIQSVYVAPAFRRRGVYRALDAAVHERAARAGDVIGIRLYVDRDNQGAERTYEALGMRASTYRLYEASIRRADPPEAVDRSAG